LESGNWGAEKIRGAQFAENDGLPNSGRSPSDPFVVPNHHVIAVEQPTNCRGVHVVEDRADFGIEAPADGSEAPPPELLHGD
jgi:hypothetical protein